MLAVRAITKITMHREHCLCGFHNFFRSDETNDIRQTGVSLYIAVAHTQATTRDQIVSYQRVVFHDGNKTDAVRENINIVQWGNGKRSFKFTWQVSLAVKRIDESLVRLILQGQFLAFNPDLMV